MTVKGQKGCAAWILVALLAVASSILGWFYYDLRGAERQAVSDLSDTKSELRSVERAQSRLQRSVDSERSVNERLQKQVIDSVEQTELAKAQFDQLTADYEQLKQVEQSLQTQLTNAATVSNSSSELQAQIDDLTLDLDVEMAFAEQTAAELVQAQQINRALVASIEQRTTELQAELDDMALDLDVEIAFAEQTAAELAQAQQVNRSLVASIEQRTAELQSELDDMALDLDVEVAFGEQLQAQLDQAQANNRAIVERVALLTEDNGLLKAQVEQLQQELNAKTDALSEAQTTEQLYQQAREQLALQEFENETYSETIDRLKNEMDAETQAMSNLEEQLQSQLEALSAEKQQLVSQLEDGTTVIKLPNSILFSTGSAELSNEGLNALSVLADAMQSFPSHLISVQGHTDGRSMSPSSENIYPTNWELSSARASSAVRELVARGVNANQMQAVGFANTRPLVEETDAVSRAQNRRIEVLLFPNQYRTRLLAEAQ